MGNSAQTNGEFQPIQPVYHFNRKEHMTWSQLIQIILKGRGKLSHPPCIAPKPGDPVSDVWDEEDSMTMV